MGRLTEVVGMLGFLFVDEVALEPDAAAAWTEESDQVLAASLKAIEQVESFTATDIEAALREALIDGLGLKPKTAFGAVRIALTGRRVSPPLFESMELLGRDRCLARLRAARAG
jgi:glutamyl-tRNA synthetase